jgi:small membrane protein
MTVFQWVVLPLLALLAGYDGYGLLFRSPFLRRDRAVRFAIWLLAAAAVFNPDFTSRVANVFGITYGKDLILYGTVLAFLAVSFAFYSWTVRTEKQITHLVRHIAKAEAKHGSDADLK